MDERVDTTRGWLSLGKSANKTKKTIKSRMIFYQE